MNRLLLLLLLIPFQLLTQDYVTIPTSFEDEAVRYSELGDYDNDGDMDVLLQAENTKIYRNDNGTFVDIGLSLPQNYSGISTWGDFDNDGDLDIGISNSYVFIYRNDSGTFTLHYTDNTVLYSGRATKWTDIDNDGDLDFIGTGNPSGNLAEILIYINDNGSFNLITKTLNVSYCNSMDAGDFDNDGDIDLLFGRNTYAYLMRNNNLNFTPVVTFTPPSTYYTRDVTFTDYDLDGDLDIVTTGKRQQSPYDEYTNVYENQNGTYAVSPISFEYDSGGEQVHITDIENDGDLDFISFQNGLPWIQINDEGEYELDYVNVDSHLMNGLSSGSTDMADINNDGFLDILFTGRDQSLNPEKVADIYLAETGNTLFQTNSSPSIPSNLNTIITGNSITFSYNPSTDNETPTISLSYNLRIGTTAGGNEILSAMANEDGSLLTPHNGNCSLKTSRTIYDFSGGTYYWSVQAIDNGRMGSGFASEETVSIIEPLSNPLLDSPPDNALDQNYVLPFFWLPVENATKYQVQIAYDNDFDHLVIDTLIYDDTTFTAINLRLETTFSWRVKAFSSVTSSEWSSIWNFKTSNYFTDVGTQFPNYEAEQDVHWGDYDNDGDLDLLITGRISFDNYEPRVYQNNNSIFTEINQTFNYRDSDFVRWVDIDNDNDLDVFLRGWDGLFVYYNDNGTYNRKDSILQLRISYGDLDFCDYDQDGDLDIFGINNHQPSPPGTFLVKNTDAGFVHTPFYGGLYNGAVASFDYDNDNDWDFVVKGEESQFNSMKTRLYKNTNGIYNYTSTGLIGASHGYIKAFDYDSDGDLDLLFSGLTDEYNSEIKTRLSENLIYNFTTMGQDFEGTPYDWQGVVYSDLIWGDYDNDGDNDIMVGESGGLYRNDNNTYNTTEISFLDVAKRFDWADYDNDGDLDMALVGTALQSRIIENNSYITNTSPNPPASKSAHINYGKLVMSWDKGTDNETAQAALTYNIYVQSVIDSSFTMAPSANLENGTRKLAQMGNVHQRRTYTIFNMNPGIYRWSVQTIDNGFHGSPFAVPDSIIILKTPTLIALANDSLIANRYITFNWDSVQYATGYRFQLSTDSLFSTFEIDTVIPDTSYDYSVTPNLTISKYYWRIYAVNSFGNSAWSDIWHFNVPVRDFKAAYSYIDKGLGDYSFSNNSTGSFNELNWDFGDGNSSSDTNTVHTFSANGTYVVVLTITDSICSSLCFDFHAETIIVTEVPSSSLCNAGFSLLPETLSNDVYVVNSSTGDNLSYTWDFGDGSISDIQYPGHTYETVGSYNLCLTISDGVGCNDTYCDSIGPNGVVFKQTGFAIKVVSPYVLGIDTSEESIPMVIIYPNPTTNKLSINCSHFTINEINIIDITQNTLITITTNLNEIDVSDLPAGIYLIRLMGDEKIIARKFIKQ